MVVWVQSANPFAVPATAPGPATNVSIDATSTASVHASAAQTISLSNLTITTGNALLVFMHFGYSPHAAGFSAVWDVGGTNQNLSFIETVDNGAAAPAIAVMALLNPTPGNKTLTMSFSTAADNMVMYAVSLNNVDTKSLSRAFTAASFTSATSAAASMTLPAILGGIQFVVAGGLTAAGAPTGWAAGPTSLYVDSAVGSWGAGAYQVANASNTFTQNIAASELWAIAGVVANPPAQLPTGTIIINGSNSIATGLAAAIPCMGNVTLTDLITAKTATPVGCSTDTSGGYGGGLSVPLSSTTAKADFGVWQPIPQGNYTILAFCNPTSGPGLTGCPLGQCDSAAAGFIDIETNVAFNTGGSAGFMASTAFNGSSALGVDDGGRPISNGTMHVGLLDGGYHAWAAKVSSGTPSMWCDGVNTTLHTGVVTGTYVNGSQHFSVGNLGNYTVSAFSAGCTIILVLVWSRALSDAEMASITANPFQVLT